MKPVYRFVQAILRVVRPLIRFNFPEVISGAGRLKEAADWCVTHHLSRVLIVTDATLMSLNLAKPLLKALADKAIFVCVYDQTQANPTVDQVEAALHLYHAHQCQAIIAIGGGSPIDCAKAVAARIARPTKQLGDLRGLLRVRKPIVPLIAIPTTAGTGSETTVAAVITDPKTKEKYAISDPVLLPRLAVLDPELLVGCPSLLSAATGMDALTHAIEAYLGLSNTFETETLALETVRLVHRHLKASIDDPSNLMHREGMQKAAFLAGKAFTQAYVGYVHALAHGLGAYYQVPHGLANAILLPHVLTSYGSSVHEKLARLADVIGLTQGGVVEKAHGFIDYVHQLNESLNIPTKLDSIASNDLDALIDHAWREAHPIYPVPRFLSRGELKLLYLAIKA